MRFFVISLFTVLLSVTASAQGTYLDRVLRIYEVGRMPALTEMNGAFSGRCYRTETPNRPFGLLLYARLRVLNPEDPGHGPLFPPPAETSIHEYNLFGRGYQGTGAPPDFWDDFTPELEQSVLDAIRTGEIARSVPWQGARVADLPHRGLSFMTRLYEIEAPDNGDVPGYFVTRLHLIPQDPRMPRPLFAACYFFKKVR